MEKNNVYGEATPIEQPQELGALIDIEPAVESATKNIQVALRESKADFWFGFMAGTVAVLGLRYIMEGKL